MNGKRAKALRTLVYGDDMSPRNRAYSHLQHTTCQIIADPLRRTYQALKHTWARRGAQSPEHMEPAAIARLLFPYERWQRIGRKP
jgi:hypothetical protein